MDVTGHQLMARLAFGNDVFLAPHGVTPRTSATEATARLLADPAASSLGHHHRQEVFAIYQHLGTRRPVWLLLAHGVPSIGSLSGKVEMHDIVDILDDRTQRPLSMIDALPNGGKSGV
ncbi:MAG TPA: hypothetical protein VMH41_05060 [Mycobacteriales bacterium]|nr:hypothetical protein [Mycobacteriales bacterium]